MGFSIPSDKILYPPLEGIANILLFQHFTHCAPRKSHWLSSCVRTFAMKRVQHQFILPLQGFFFLMQLAFLYLADAIGYGPM